MNEKTALHYAVEGGNDEIVEFLLSMKDIDINSQNISWWQFLI